MKTVFFDVDTQLDFLFPAGALYVPGAETIAPLLSRLTAFAKHRHIPVFSTMDTHLEDDPEFRIWKPHCVRGTQGWHKYAPTFFGQTVFEKNHIDFFDDPRLAPLLDSLQADRFVVYGLVTEYCVRSALFGLLKRSPRVELVTDAAMSLDSAKEKAVVEQFTASGGKLITSQQLLTE